MDSSEAEDLIGRPPPAAVNESMSPAKPPRDRHRLWNPISIVYEPFRWLAMLCRELNATFVFGVVLVYGLSQGFAGSFFRVVTDFYWKDVQKVQPSAVQMYMGLYYIPWVMKPVWGILTDVFPVYGYRRRPYFVIAGFLGTSTAIIIATYNKLAVATALLCLVGMTAAVAIADVTIDACIARNSIERPTLAADMQSLCGFVSSVGALIGYSTSGVFVHLLGAQGALGLMAIPAVLLILLGFVIFEVRTGQQRSDKRKVWVKVSSTVKGMGRAIQCPQVWKPALYMFLSLALSYSTHEGHFYWYTDPKAGPAFSKAFIGVIYAIGAMASLLGVLIYHKFLKDYPFRGLLFYAQLLYGFSGMLDLFFILRLNLKLHIPDAVFVILEECCSRIVSRIRWMPMMVLSTRLCPLGIEGTFFALLMCIDSLGSLTSKTFGGVVLRLLHVTRVDFRNLWLAALLRNLLRFATLGFIFLVPNLDQNDALLPPELMKSSSDQGSNGEESLQLVKLNGREEV